MKIIPITLKQANAYVTQYHRHHKACAGCKFCIGVEDNGQLVGVAICGRPVSRHLDNGKTLEINRLGTNGMRNACSKLYGACARIARDMGYERIITYILESENGASLKASNFVCEGTAGGKIWTGERKRNNGVPPEMKQRYTLDLKKSRRAGLMVDKELFYNGSGCADPTAYNAIRKVEHDRAVENVNRLIKEIKALITYNGFVLLNRIELKDEKSGIIFK